MSDIDTVYQENRALEAEIERLKARVEELKETVAFLDPPYGILELEDQLDAANERIEELKESIDADLDMDYLACIRGHNIITYEQIDAAWADVDDWGMYQAKGHRLLAGLNIHRCEHYTDDEELLAACDRCHGHEWVIR